ncbi:MAG: RNA methyltransferase [Ruminococcus sp.]|nr:RNA methyltransferase [Ruminococcus sp.]
MTDIIEITDLSIPELLPYTDTSELKLLREGIFIAESPKVIRTALECGYEPVSMLMEKKYVTGQARDIIEKSGDIPVYCGSADTLEELTGFRMTQGVLAAMKRRALPDVEDILAKSSRVALLEKIMNQTNAGAVFRSAAALGFDAVLLTEGCCDPLFRRSVRVSMGTVFQIPWTYIGGDSPEYIRFLQEHGFVTAAMALRDDTVRIDDPRLTQAQKLAAVLGTEGDGLLAETIRACDYTIKIPMSNGVDSLNVAAASAVTFWTLGRH